MNINRGSAVTLGLAGTLVAAAFVASQAASSSAGPDASPASGPTLPVFDRDVTRNVVAKMLVDPAEHGGWELDRVQIGPDGTRRVVLRRKIIRQPRPTLRL